MTTPTPRPLCEHPQDRLVHSTYRAQCSVCGSYWDLESLAATVAYDESYPAERGHFDPRVGALKVRTLDHWVRAGQVTLDGKTVCEVGFGGEHVCHIWRRVRRTSSDSRSTSRPSIVSDSLGVRAELLRVDPLPRLAHQVDLWLFQDSFEHIPDPATFADWMRVHSSASAEILLVAPRGDSLSRRLMGRFWPHKLPDHQFHWSHAGLAEFFARRGFAVRRSFFPLKFASPQMVLAHFLHKLGVGESLRRRLAGASFALPINFGEHGLVFERRDG